MLLPALNIADQITWAVILVVILILCYYDRVFILVEQMSNVCFQHRSCAPIGDLIRNTSLIRVRVNSNCLICLHHLTPGAIKSRQRV